MGKYKFEQIAINSTAKKKPVEEDKYTYLGLEHLDSENLKVTRFGSEVAPIGEKLLMKKGDILFGKRRAYQKKVAIAPFDGIFSAHGMVLRPNTKVINKDFFPIFISSDYFLDEAIKISVGSLSPTINWKDLKELEFNLPEIEEQEKLAKTLWSMIDTIESYKDLLVKINDLIKAKFLDYMSKKSRMCKLSDYCVTDITNARLFIDKNDVIKYVEISSIDSDLNKVTDPTDIIFGNSPTSAKYLLKKNDVLVSLVRPNLKKIAINNFEMDNVVGTNGFCVLRPKEGISPYLLKAIVLSDDFTENMISLQTGSTYPTIKNKDVLNYSVPILENEEIVEITKILKAGNLTQNRLNESLTELKALYKKMIYELLNSKED